MNPVNPSVSTWAQKGLGHMPPGGREEQVQSGGERDSDPAPLLTSQRWRALNRQLSVNVNATTASPQAYVGRRSRYADEHTAWDSSKDPAAVSIGKGVRNSPPSSLTPGAGRARAFDAQRGPRAG
ncbi:hypothetical protein SKAU_G00331140 [Synaphobranchus kaupii]|uniref:Uncharacterized protein n=1 Tax=Synaphobranchus kaupii TaxID=118154 RepID=A0A9Q1EL65_SYNKA|nr:hypothetical protein SKAU_G00331140 [Synaphobranchus kaupii]